MEKDESFSGLFGYQNHAPDGPKSLELNSQFQSDGSISNFSPLCEKMKRIGRPDNIECCQDFEQRLQLVEAEMGSMALCRGKRGENLHQAGAIYAILQALEEIFDKVPNPNTSSLSNMETEFVMKFAASCWGAARDLSCGSAPIRDAFQEFTTKAGLCGLELMIMYLNRYHEVYWDDLDVLHLKLVTNVIGAIRNVTHSTTENCNILNEHGATDLLIWRLKRGSKKKGEESNLSLPSPSKRWRDGAFRCCATLINMAEKNEECAQTCATDLPIIQLLLESWGGMKKKLPVIHLGLIAVLESAKDRLPEDKFDAAWDNILEKEKVRKSVAKQREERRKQLLTIQK
mmetsp:Transcript_19462/g.29262  ORF Transcript_19462/g.29262 Transcript_19462/m.29262 type:complete len:344 (-) Transcript_19462:104-1135(-)